MINPVAELRALLSAALVRPDDREDHESPELVRRRWVSAVAAAIGCFLMAWVARIPPGDPSLYAAGMALAITWAAGGLLSGRLHLGSDYTRAGAQIAGAVVQALALGLLLVGIFLGCAALIAPVPVLRESLQLLLDHAGQGTLPLLIALVAVNAVAEELYFRGGLYAAVGGRPAVAVTTIVYALVTIPSGIPLLALTGAALGLVLGLQRRVTDGVLGPIITHLVWAMGMLFLLPRVLGFWS